MATVTTQRPEPVDTTYVLTLSQQEALELAGILGRTYGGLVGDLYWALDDELSHEVGNYTEHPDHKAGENARIAPPAKEQ